MFRGKIIRQFLGKIICQIISHLASSRGSLRRHERRMKLLQRLAPKKTARQLFNALSTKPHGLFTESQYRTYSGELNHGPTATNSAILSATSAIA